jgi:hypothetical protein
MVTHCLAQGVGGFRQTLLLCSLTPFLKGLRMRTPGFVMALIVGLSVGSPTHAASIQCTTADKSAWLPPAKVRAMLEQHGFTKVSAPKPSDGNCYVVQATDNSGAKKTLYLNPTDGALMAME